MDKIALNLGFIQIYWYSIMIFTALVVGCIVIFLEAKKQKLQEEFLLNLIFYSVILGVFGARLYYCLFNLSYYLANPLEIFQLWNGGLAIHGGIITALIFIIYYCKKHQVNIYKLLDILVVGLIIGQAIGRWGNFFNQEAYGNITTLAKLQHLHIPSFIINNMYILGNYRQPTFLYESILCLLGFLLMLCLRKFHKRMQTSTLTGFYLLWYGFTRFFIESMRSDSLMLGPFKMAQLVSIVFIFVGLFFLLKNFKDYDETHNYQKMDIYIKNKKHKIK